MLNDSTPTSRRGVKTVSALLTLMLFLLSSWQLIAQNTTVSGTVRDETGTGLPGVNVLKKGTTDGTTTDADGRFQLNANSDDILVFSFIGYTSQEVNVGAQTEINVQLVADIRALDEVVVVGYGTQKKSDLTGAVSIADPTEMKKQATSDVVQMMQGRIAGVAITSDGQAGATPSVRIRGVSTFTLSAEPLYVVDGFPLSGGIRDINPNDIESIQVLKDATAGAIYGNRGANGIVIITTKKGAKNKGLSVDFNTYYGFQTVPQRLPVLTRVGYQNTNNELLKNAGRPLVPGNDPDSEFFIDDIDTDWQDEGYQDGSIQNYNLNFAGGTDKTNYFVSLDYLDNKGTLVGTGPNYKRYSFRVNTETTAGKFKIGQNLYVTRSDENPLFSTTSINIPGNRPSLVNDLLQAAPTIPVYDPNREGGFGGADAVIHQSITLNVPGINTLIENETLVNRVLANVYGQYEIAKGLNFKIDLQYDNTDITDQLFVPSYDLGYFFPNENAQYQVSNRSISSSLIENTLNYTKKFDKHDVNVLVGQSYQEFDSREIRAIGVGFDKPYIKSLKGAQGMSVVDNQDPSALASYFGRVNYAYDDRYLLTFNIRRDGSSRFREDVRNAIFPSIGVAWKVHNDFQLPEFISDLKLRGGWGQVGNQNIPNFAYQATINRSIPYEYSSGRVLGGAATIVVDPLISWEIRTTRSVAIDATVLNGKIDFTAEYYSNQTDDALVQVPIPLSVGSLPSPGAPFPALLTNAGSIRNSGIELSMSYRENIGDFSFEISPNFYTLKNEVLAISNYMEIMSGAGSRTVVGRSIGEHYGWVFDGIFQSAEEINTVGPNDPAFDASKHAFQRAGTGAGDVRFKDLNEDGVINDDDRTFLGQGMPTFYYGLNLSAKYKGFDFTLFLSGSGGNYINSNLYRGLMPTSSYTNWHEDINDHWTTDNPSNEIPRVMWGDPNDNQRDSNRPGWLQKGDYMRINTLSLGYSLPQSLLEKIHLKSARIYTTLQNVSTFASYKGYNPDFTSGILNPGFDYGTYPRPKTTMFGLQVKF
jgi:TonB-dependent starch-binding outer membrane protein SusC